METGLAPRGRALWIALGLVLLIRVPFLNQAIQGDDHIYLTEAAHALIDPLHPNNVKYVFLGDEVDLRGNSHPPGNAWPLAVLIAAFGDVKEVPFHAAYIVFSLIAVWAMWSLAVRFSPQPFWATLLFLAVPAFVVNGGSLEADLPFLAFWMAGVALFCADRLVLSALCMAAAAMMAYQAVFLAPILAVYVWLHHTRGQRARRAWPLLAPLLTVVAWQVYTRMTTGVMPAAQLSGYLSSYGFQQFQHKLENALMLFIHSWFIVCPLLVPATFLLAWRKRREPDTLFLLAWIGIFFAGALVVFFAGSARYLLPMAAPVALLASRLRPKWLALGFAVQLALGLGLAIVNYQHWDGYREFAAALRGPAAGHRVWVDNDWGLRYYLEADHGLAARKGQHLRPGDIVVSSQLGSNVQFTVPLSPIAKQVIQPAIPLRLIGLESHSGYSTVAKGFWPFGISAGVIDRVRAAQVMERHPTLEYLTLGAPGAAEQIVSGIDPSDHWMFKSAVVVVKNPAVPSKLRVAFYISGKAPARHITLSLDGREVAAHTYSGPGSYTLDSSQAVVGSGDSAAVQIDVDRTFFAPGDKRELGVVLMGVGFVR
jgi:hypothetical protein